MEIDEAGGENISAELGRGSDISPLHGEGRMSSLPIAA